MKTTQTIEVGQKMILSKWQGKNQPRRPMPVIVVEHNCGDVWIVREAISDEQYPAIASEMKPCKAVPSISLTQRQKMILAYA